jgi:hypothetical protein
MHMVITTRLWAVLLALVVGVAAMALVLVGPGAKPAKTQVLTPPPTLTGESLQAVSCRSLVDPTQPCINNNFDELPGEVTVTSSIFLEDCTSEGGGDVISYQASGPVTTGPYTGTFTESGTFTLDSEGQITSFKATFTIEEKSPTGEVTTKVTGTKESTQDFSGSLNCPRQLGGHYVILSAPEGQVSYEAKIVTSSGTFIDRGTATGSASDPLDPGLEDVGLYTVTGVPGEGSLGDLIGHAQLDSFGETFTSQLAQVERVLPTTKAQCKKGGYQQLGFANEGDCVSFVQTEGKNQPK